MRHLLTLILISSFFMTSCKSDKTGISDTDINIAAQDSIAALAEKKYTLTPFSPSKNFPDAEILDMKYANGKFGFSLAKGSYTLGAQTDDADSKMCANSGEGQHIHLIVDDQPYAAKYTADFDYEIPDGEHYLLSFLSRSYHESIKTDKAHVAKKVTIKGNSIIEAAPIMESMVFYSRPKGTYSGIKETEKVMLDFYPINANLGTTQKLIVTINGEEHVITKWEPYYITGLPIGENTITLALVDMDGNKINAPNNPVERTFTLRGDTAE